MFFFKKISVWNSSLIVLLNVSFGIKKKKKKVIKHFWIECFETMTCYGIEYCDVEYYRYAYEKSKQTKNIYCSDNKVNWYVMGFKRNSVSHHWMLNSMKKVKTNKNIYHYQNDNEVQWLWGLRGIVVASLDVEFYEKSKHTEIYT